MTRYYVDVSTELVQAYKSGDLKVPDGFRLIERFGPRYAETERWIVEDDGADEEFEGYLISPVFKMTLIGEGPDYIVEVVDREIQRGRY